jgi:exonuclease SbcD
VWLTICDYAVEHKADAVVVSGDVFLNGWPRPEAVEMIFDGVRLLSQAGVPLIVSDGNHESINRPKGHRSPLEHLKDLAHVTVVTEPGLVVLDSGLQIAAFPWPLRAALLQPGDADGLTPSEIDELVAARAVERIESLADQVDPARGPVMLMGHATVGDCVIGSSRRGSEMQIAELFSEPVIPLSDIDVDPWQHVALGHIHRRQQLGKRCWYAGSPDRLDFSDEGLDKAFSVVSIPDNGQIAKVESVPTPARRFKTITVAQGASIVDIESILPKDADGTIFRIELPPGSDMALSAEVRRVVEAVDGEVARVIAPPPARTDSDRVIAEEDIKPLDGLDLWLPTQDIPSDMKKRAREKAMVLLNEINPKEGLI